MSLTPLIYRFESISAQVQNKLLQIFKLNPPPNVYLLRQLTADFKTNILSLNVNSYHVSLKTLCLHILTMKKLFIVGKFMYLPLYQFGVFTFEFLYKYFCETMVKQNSQAKQTKMNTRFDLKQITNAQLKAIGLKKANQTQKKKCQSTKISKLHSDVFQTPKRILKVEKQLFKQIIDESMYQCPVCLELMIQPTLLQCGHAYCFKCIEELMIYKSNCGVCRNIQTEPQFQRSKYLETLIEKIVIKKSYNYLDYYCRMTDTQNWKKVRNASVNELTKGSFIDFRDKQLKWRKGEVLKLSFSQGKQVYQIQVRYKKEGQIVTETIASDSGRYAKFTYYTRMKYLQPRQNFQYFQNRQSQEVLYTPLTDSFVDMPDGIDQLWNEDHQETPFQLIQQNIEIQRTELPNLFSEENQFLNQIFQSQYHEAADFIELLA